MAQSLFRKYRPQVFDDVVGQEHVERTLVNAVAGNNVSHAYLFCGPRGTGKTTTARLLAKALLCTADEGNRPDGTCDECLAVAEARHPDVYELDAASRTGVDNVREEIIGRVQFAPTRGAYKVYIIDEVHMLSPAAFNALLKTLEEPPAHVVFILCTTDPQKIPATILSRCQRFDFRRFSMDELVGRLSFICEQEGIQAEPEALSLIASHAQGGMRDAIGALDQLAAFTGGNITRADAEGLLGETGVSQLFQITDLVARRDVAGCFEWVARFVEGGTDLLQFSHELALHVRNLYVTALTGGHDGIVNADEATIARYAKQATLFEGTDRLARMLTILDELAPRLRNATDPRLAVEVALTRMARPEGDLTLESLAERVESLEARLAAGAGPAPDWGAVQAAMLFVEEQGAAASDSQVARITVIDEEDDEDLGDEAEPAPAPPEKPAPAPQPEPEPQPHSAPEHFDDAPTEAPSFQPPQPGTGELTAESAQRLWAAAVKDARARETALVGVLSGTVAEVGADGESLVIKFPSKAMFGMKMAEQAAKREVIASSLATVFGRPMRFVYELAHSTSPLDSGLSFEFEPEPEPSAAPAPEQAAEPEPAAEQVSFDDYQPEEVPLDLFEDDAATALADDQGFESDSAPTAAPQPAPEPEPEPEPQPEPAPEPEPQPAPAPEDEEEYVVEEWADDEAADEPVWYDAPAPVAEPDLPEFGQVADAGPDLPEFGQVAGNQPPADMDSGIASMLTSAFGGGVSFDSVEDE